MRVTVEIPDEVLACMWVDNWSDPELSDEEMVLNACVMKALQFERWFPTEKEKALKSWRERRR